MRYYDLLFLILANVTQHNDSKERKHFLNYDEKWVLFRDAGGKFGEMEAAREEEYFRKLVCHSLCL